MLNNVRHINKTVSIPRSNIVAFSISFSVVVLINIVTMIRGSDSLLTMSIVNRSEHVQPHIIYTCEMTKRI